MVQLLKALTHITTPWKCKEKQDGWRVLFDSSSVGVDGFSSSWI